MTVFLRFFYCSLSLKGIALIFVHVGVFVCMSFPLRLKKSQEGPSEGGAEGEADADDDLDVEATEDDETELDPEAETSKLDICGSVCSSTGSC